MTATLLAFALAIVGAAALAAAMDRHHRQINGRPATHRLAWRLLGTTAWATSLGMCAASLGWAVGVVQWLGMLTVGCLLVMAMLAFWPGLLLGGKAGAAVSKKAISHRGAR